MTHFVTNWRVRGKDEWMFFFLFPSVCVQVAQKGLDWQFPGGPEQRPPPLVHVG